MRTAFLALLATVTGALVSIVVAYVGAVVLLLIRFGIPLGSDGRDPTAGELGGLLLIAGSAAAIGGHVAARIARDRSPLGITALAMLLASGALWGFGSASSQWPRWWAPALAGVAALGVWVGGMMRRSQRRGRRAPS